MRYWLTFLSKPGAVADKMRQITREAVRVDPSFSFDRASISRCDGVWNGMHVVNVACECDERTYFVLQEIELADLYFATAQKVGAVCWSPANP